MINIIWLNKLQIYLFVFFRFLLRSTDSRTCEKSENMNLWPCPILMSLKICFTYLLFERNCVDMWLASNFILYSWKSLSSISRAVCRIIFISPPFFLKFISPIWKIHWQVQQDVGKCNMIYRHFLSISSPFLPLLISAVPISLIQAFKIFSWHHINDT